jgi:hypothetical protein
MEEQSLGVTGAPAAQNQARTFFRGTQPLPHPIRQPANRASTLSQILLPHMTRNSHLITPTPPLSCVEPREPHSSRPSGNPRVQPAKPCKLDYA